MKHLLLVIALLFPTRLFAQVIHQYPYDPAVTSYSSPAAWPFLSAQCHWRPANAIADPTSTPQLMSPSLGHTHVEANVPIYGEINHNVIINFDVVLFHIDGVISTSSAWDGGPLISGVVFDQAGDTLPGDPNGVVTYTGHATIDLSLANGSGYSNRDIPKHGWFNVQLSVTTFLTNGDRMHTLLGVPLFSVIDPTQPEQFFPQDARAVGAQCSGGSAQDTPSDAIGQAEVVFYPGYVPILSPLNVAVNSTPSLYGYGTTTLPNGTGMTRFDMDLHHGIAGTLIQTADGPPAVGVNLNSPFDPAILGPGTHKVATFWQQDTRLGNPGQTIANEQATSILVLIITVGGIPPPPPTWTTEQGVFQQEDQDPTKFRFCPTATPTICTAFMKM